MTFGPAVFDGNAPAFDVARFAQTLAEGGDELRKPDGRCVGEIADHWHRRLLRARPKRPRRRAAEQRDELAAPDHSFTSSARASTVAGMSRPSTFAVVKLMSR